MDPETAKASEAGATSEADALDDAAREPSAPSDAGAPSEAGSSITAGEPDDAGDALERAERFSAMLDHNIALRVPAMTALAACTRRRPLAEVIDEVQARLEAAGKLPVQPVSSVIDALGRAGVVDKSVEVDGKPYAGTLRDAIDDDSLPEDATLEEFVAINDAGRLAQRLNAPERRVSQLFGARPHLRAGMLATLRLCDTQEGMSTRALQERLDGMGLLERDGRTGLPTLYPSTFCNSLKDVGALDWRNHAWVTTDLGRRALDAQAEA
ncbi:MAG: hypothetical protein SOI26_04535 [Coriobacteriales bacterium]|jgi:hypothetical protein